MGGRAKLTGTGLTGTGLTGAELTGAQALQLRMTSLLLRPRPTDDPRPAPDTVADVVTWFGAMQAQDLASGLWSLGARLPGHTLADVNAALERREAIRTWPMRGTVHWIPPNDAHWMLEVMGSRALAGAAGRRAYLGLTESLADRGVEVLGKALAGGGRLTRAQCLATLTEAGVECTGQFGYHLLWYASQCGVTCIAPNIGKEQTFVLLDEWATEPNRLSREEALATIALRYFRSHGPTTRQDFAGWTGLTAADAKLGIAGAGSGTGPRHGRRRRGIRRPGAAGAGPGAPVRAGVVGAARFRRIPAGLQGPFPDARRGAQGGHHPGRQRGVPVHSGPRRPGGRHLEAHHRKAGNHRRHHRAGTTSQGRPRRSRARVRAVRRVPRYAGRAALGVTPPGRPGNQTPMAAICRTLPSSSR